jgi:hypothetical protein
MNHLIDKLLDAGGVTTMIAGIITGSAILAILGGLASIAAFINHADQYLQRRKKRKSNVTDHN